jgi:excisionase family DNA binding protein
VAAVRTLLAWIGGGALIALGTILRRSGIVAAGKARLRSGPLERRWISNPSERQRHAAIVADRLGIASPDAVELSVADAARRLGVSPSTVRRRVQRGELLGAYRAGHLTGIVLDPDGPTSDR